MKMIKFAFSLSLSFFFFLNSQAQIDFGSQLSIGAGYGAFIPAGDIESDKIILSNGINSGSGSISYNVEGINFFINYEKVFSPKLSLGIGGNFLQKEGVFNSDRKTVIGALEFDHKSNAELKVLHGDLIAYYNLFSNIPIDIKLGLGPSLVYREHLYRDYVEFDVSDGESATIVAESFTTSKETAGGLTGQIKIDYPINEQFFVGVNASKSLYFNSDEGGNIGASIGYKF